MANVRCTGTVRALLTLLVVARVVGSAQGQVARAIDENPNFKGPHEPWIGPDNCKAVLQASLESKDKLLFMRVGDLGVEYNNGDWKRNGADESSWSDPRVLEWLGAHALGPRHQLSDTALHANALGLGQLPKGVYAVRNGTVIDQDLLFTSAEEVLEWAKLLQTGDVTAEFARKRAGERSDTCALIPHVICAERLERIGEAESAADEYAWVIEAAFGIGRKPAADGANARPARAGNRIDLFYNYPLFSRAGALAPKFPAVQKRIESARDEMMGRFLNEAPGERQPLSLDFLFSFLSAAPDALAFNKIMDAVAGDPELRSEAERQQERLISSLALRGRWEDAGKLVREPVKLARRCMGNYQGLVKVGRITGKQPEGPPSDAYAQLASETEISSASDCAVLYACLLAAGREKEAAETAEATFAIHDSPAVRVAFVFTCLDAKQVRPIHLDWAKEADKDAQLIDQRKTFVQQVEESLSQPKK